MNRFDEVKARLLSRHKSGQHLQSLALWVELSKKNYEKVQKLKRFNQFFPVPYFVKDGTLFGVSEMGAKKSARWYYCPFYSFDCVNNKKKERL